MTDNSPDNLSFEFPLVAEGVDRVPAQFRAMYQPGENGELRLMPEVAKRFDNSGFQTALQKERTARRESEKRAKSAEQRLTEMADKIGAASLDEIQLKTEELLGRASPVAADAVRAEIENRFKATYGAQLAQKEAEATKLRKTLQTTLIDGEAVKAIADAKGVTRALMPHVTGSMKLIEEDGELRPRIVDGRGEVRYGSDGLPMTAAALVAEMRKDDDFAGLFAGSGSSGAGTRGASGTGGNMGGSAAQSMDLAAWKLKMAKAKPDERTELIRAKTAGRIVIRD